MRDEKAFNPLGDPSSSKDIACKLRSWWTLTLSIFGKHASRLARYAPLAVDSMFTIPKPPCLGLSKHCLHWLGDRD